MALIDHLLPEYDRETGTTRRLLERVPDTAFGFAPHETSMTLGRLASHISDLPSWVELVMRANRHDLAPGYESPQATGTTALLTRFDTNVGGARATLVGVIDDLLTEPWTLTRGGQELFTLPRITMLRYFVINHLIHHRGQLSVYLRLQRTPIPAIYGPAANERGF
jgi:uncharacterized damage-inducible protein DinB